jgi:hypothetical protein
MDNTQYPNQHPNQPSNQDPAGGRRGARIAAGGAVATGLFVALLFGVYSVNGGGGDGERSATAPPAVASPRIDEPDVVRADEPATDETPSDDDSEAVEPADDVVTPVGDPSPDPMGLRNLCANVVHGEASSGIWVRGEVYGLESGWIFVQAETVNGGEPVQLPVESGSFDSPLPILQYGDHEVTRFELVPDGPEATPVDLMPALLDGPGAVFPVDAGEGPVFDSECFDIEPVAPVPDVEHAGDPAGAPEAELVEAFVDGFVEDHRTGDVAGLLTTLHPAIPLSFGDDVCTEYVERTTGSIADATVVDVGRVGPLELDTAAGPIGFPESIPFTVEFTLADGSSMVNEANLPLHNGTVHWLTTCGVDVP